MPRNVQCTLKMDVSLDIRYDPRVSTASRKELKAAMSALDDAQGKVNAATTSEGHFQGCTAVDASLQAL
jgi:hypothetical protein